MEWYKDFLSGTDPVLSALENGISEAVTALIGIKVSLNRLPARVPDCVAILDVIIMAIAVNRGVVIAVTCQTKELGISIETVSA